MVLPLFSGRLASSIAAQTAAPEEINVLGVLRLTEGSLAPVACLEENSRPCARAAQCRTLPLWKGLNDVVTEYLGGFTIRDLMGEPGSGFDYII